MEDKIYEFNSDEESVKSLHEAMGKAYNKVDNKRLSMQIHLKSFENVRDSVGARN